MHLIQSLKNDFCFDLPMFSKYPAASIKSYFYKMTLVQWKPTARASLLSLCSIQVYSIPSAMRPPTSANTDNMNGIPIIPKPRQNIRPAKVEVAKLP